MIDYREAFVAGVRAYEQTSHEAPGVPDWDAVVATCQEIMRVFDDFERQIWELSGDTMGVAIRTLRGSENSRLSISAERLVGAGERPVEAWLCGVSLGEHGYPVTLEYHGVQAVCADEAALEAGLEAMLRHPGIGGSIRRVMGVPVVHGSDT